MLNRGECMGDKKRYGCQTDELDQAGTMMGTRRREGGKKGRKEGRKGGREEGRDGGREGSPEGSFAVQSTVANLTSPNGASCRAVERNGL